jgi:opacity protein-like surface antigen
MNTKKLTITMAVFAATALVTGAWAVEINPYIAAGTGLSTINNMKDAGEKPTGLILSGAVGAQIKLQSVNLRGELAYSSRDLDSSSWEEIVTGVHFVDTDIKVAQTMYLGNFYIDFLEDYAIKPYFGITAGYAASDHNKTITTSIGSSKTKTTFPEVSDNGFVYGAEAGFGFGLTDGLLANIGVRYNWVALDKTMEIFDINLGVRYTF